MSKNRSNLPQINESTATPPQVMDLSTNNPNQQKAADINSQQKTTDMVSHSSVSKPDTKISDTMSRLRQRSRLRNLQEEENKHQTIITKNLLSWTETSSLQPTLSLNQSQRLTPHLPHLWLKSTLRSQHTTVQTKAPAGETLQHNSKSVNQLKNATTRPQSLYKNEDMQSRAPYDNGCRET